jgi:type II secretory ATPase GspE/PulE/Tfp pilus assembly ATPase PilB-like protein
VVEAANREDPAEFIRAAREQMARHNLRRDAVRAVTEGRTTAHEAMRTTSQYEE